METKARNPIIAAILSLIIPGLGQIYNGQLIKGLIFFVIIVLSPIILFLFNIHHTFIGLIILFVIKITMYLANSVEAFYSAKKLKEIPLRIYDRWYFYVLCIFIVLISQSIFAEPLLKSIFQSHISQDRFFTIPSAAMAPTIIVGDKIVADMKYYNDYKPQKGDVIILEQPDKPSTYLIKRIIATEGDIIESKNKIIYLNSNPIKETYIQHTDNENIPANKDNRDNFGPFKIPPDSIFVMGDNRENSNDSRQFGNIDMELVKGKVLYIFWSKDTSRIGLTVK